MRKLFTLALFTTAALADPDHHHHDDQPTSGYKKPPDQHYSGDSDSVDYDVERSYDTPAYYAKAVDSFDIDSIFIDENCYQQQIDIYSDQLVAIEALRRLIVEYNEKVDVAEEWLGINDTDENRNRRDDLDVKTKARINANDIEILEVDIGDVEACLWR